MKRTLPQDPERSSHESRRTILKIDLELAGFPQVELESEIVAWDEHIIEFCEQTYLDTPSGLVILRLGEGAFFLLAQNYATDNS